VFGFHEGIRLIEDFRKFRWFRMPVQRRLASKSHLRANNAMAKIIIFIFPSAGIDAIPALNSNDCRMRRELLDMPPPE
jgi:hypothetical protein